MFRFVVYQASWLVVFAFLGLPALSFGGDCGCGHDAAYCRSCAHVHCSHPHCRHGRCHHCCHGEPPRAPVVQSMAAPLVVASPVAFAAPVAAPSFSPFNMPCQSLPQSSVRPDALRAMANYLENQEKAAQALMATCNGTTGNSPTSNSASSGPSAVPSAPPDAAMSEQVSDLEVRMRNMENRIDAINTSTNTLIDRLNTVLDKLK